MTHQPYDDRREPSRLADILARDEAHPTLGKQVLNGIGGLLVLWKSP